MTRQDQYIASDGRMFEDADACREYDDTRLFHEIAGLSEADLDRVRVRNPGDMYARSIGDTIIKIANRIAARRNARASG